MAEAVRTAGPRRESPGESPAVSTRPAGWRIVAAKELADQLLSVRFTVLIALLGLAAMLSVYAASGAIRDVAPEANQVPALFLRLFTIAPEDLPAFVSMVGLVGFLAPLLGIAFGFDSVSGERSQGTLPRLVAQPIHRDDVINGKFGAGLAVIGVVLTALTLIVAGLGLSRLGIVPTAEEVARMLVWLVVTMVYVAFWLGFASLCSVALRRAATSALVAIAAWLVLALFWNLLVGLVANAVAPVPEQPTIEEQVRNLSFEQRFGRLSPSRLYEEVTFVILRPEQNFGPYGFLLPQQLDRAVFSELSLGQSILLVWPQIVGLVALTVICFAVAYVLFMRQEIRA